MVQEERGVVIGTSKWEGGRGALVKARAVPCGSHRSADVESLAATAVFSAVSFADPEKEFFDSFVYEEVLAAVDGIPDPYREALVLSDLQGMAYPEISETLEVPVETLKSRIFRGWRLLQEALYEYALEMGYVIPEGVDSIRGVLVFINRGLDEYSYDNREWHAMCARRAAHSSGLRFHARMGRRPCSSCAMRRSVARTSLNHPRCPKGDPGPVYTDRRVDI